MIEATRQYKDCLIKTMSRQPTSFKITWNKVPLSAIACSNKLSRVYYMYVNRTRPRYCCKGTVFSYCSTELDHTEILLTLNIQECKQRASGGAFKAIYLNGSCRVRKQQLLLASCEFYTAAKKREVKLSWPWKALHANCPSDLLVRSSQWLFAHRLLLVVRWAISL